MHKEDRVAFRHMDWRTVLFLFTEQLHHIYLFIVFFQQPEEADCIIAYRFNVRQTEVKLNDFVIQLDTDQARFQM